MTINTPRAQIARFVREKIQNESRVELPDLVEMVIGRFGGDRQFVDQLLREQLSPLIYTIAQNVVAQTRGGTILVGQTVASAQVARVIVGGRPRWQGWLEHTGTGYTRLPEMTRVELLDAANQRGARAAREANLETLWRTLAAGMSDGQQVRDVYDDAAIDRVVESLATGGGLPDGMQLGLPSATVATATAVAPGDGLPTEDAERLGVADHAKS